MVFMLRHRGPVLAACALFAALHAHADTLTVTTSADAGPGSLRSALVDAAALPGTTTIRFASGVGVITLSSTLTITSPVLIDGDADGDGGPDVTVSGGGTVRVFQVDSGLTAELKGLTITQGLTGSGGAGVFAGSTATLTLRDAVVSGNREIGGGGGGVYCTSCTVRIFNSVVRDNTSTSFGGGVRVAGSGGGLEVIGSTISGNTTNGLNAHGGGIQFGGTNPFRMVNSTVSGNATLGSDSFGGGVRHTSGTSEVIHSTIVGNAATSWGGGVYANGTETYINTVVAGNTSGAGATPGAAGAALATGGSPDDVASTVETAVNSFFGTSTGINSNQGSVSGQGTAGLLLDALAPSAGATPAHAFALASVLRDAAACVPAAPTDQRGVSRPQGLRCDIGALELTALATQVSVTGPGAVSANPVGIANCTATGGSCTMSTFSTDPSITLTATPDAGQGFVGWGGACAGANPVCVVPSGVAQSVSASFASSSATLTTPGGNVGLQLAGSNCVLAGTPQTAPATPLPAGTVYPFGPIGFQAVNCTPGGSVTLTLTLPGAVPAGATLLKYVGNQWVEWPFVAQGPNTLAFTVTDAQSAGQVGAATGDLNAAPGVIDDPVVLAVPAASAEPVPVPLLGPVGLWLMSLLVAVAGGACTLRRRRV